MTLSPVFRSDRAVRLLAEHGVWERLGTDMEAQGRAVRQVFEDLESIIGEQFRRPNPPVPGPEDLGSPEGLGFLQEYFFLILFRSIFASLGVPEARLQCYAELNFCIKGTITAADNIFDDQAKSLLPLADHAGARFLSILQLMSFERLLRAALDRAEANGVLSRSDGAEIQRSLMDRMAEIGVLEGSEEGGVDGVPTPDAMVDAVHRVRGGALFALAFAAPTVLEGDDVSAQLVEAEAAISRLGTAFQIVDDLTDFEFDVRRRSHNLLVSQVVHSGTVSERAALERLEQGGEAPPHVVEEHFADSARAVLGRAYEEADAAFRALADLGHWFDPGLSDDVVHAIVGLEGVARMEALTSE
ncbi:MAG: hypothetical protein AAF389_21450 [Gemmatimonadota bacterium]